MRKGVTNTGSSGWAYEVKVAIDKFDAVVPNRLCPSLCLYLANIGPIQWRSSIACQLSVSKRH